jgi:hypothetical protein
MPALQSLLRAHNPPSSSIHHICSVATPGARSVPELVCTCRYMPRTRAGKAVQEGIAVYAPYLANFRLASSRLACLTDCRLTDQQPWLYGSRVKHISYKTCLSLTCLVEYGSKIRGLRPCKLLPYSQYFRLLRSMPMPRVTSSHVHTSTTLSLVSIHACVYTSRDVCL